MQAENSNQLMFHEEADTLNLTVTLSDNKLTLTLKDFVDWIIYSKEYTKGHIGGEIHQKMDLFDVYTAFSRTKSNNGEENIN